MVTYGVTLNPAPGVTEQEMAGLLARIQALQGSLPGLVKVEIHPAVGVSDQSRRYTMTFDTEAHMQAYTAHPAYQAIRSDLHRISPNSTASAIALRTDICLSATDEANGRA